MHYTIIDIVKLYEKFSPVWGNVLAELTSAVEVGIWFADTLNAFNDNNLKLLIKWFKLFNYLDFLKIIMIIFVGLHSYTVIYSDTLLIFFSMFLLARIQLYPSASVSNFWKVFFSSSLFSSGKRCESSLPCFMKKRIT